MLKSYGRSSDMGAVARDAAKYDAMAAALPKKPPRRVSELEAPAVVTAAAIEARAAARRNPPIKPPARGKPRE